MGTAGATNAMHIVFCMEREVEIHDVGDAVHINATSSNVCGHKNPHCARFEIGQRLQTLILRAVRMQSRAVDARLF
jgi:hypothetical protein